MERSAEQHSHMAHVHSIIANGLVIYFRQMP